MTYRLSFLISLFLFSSIYGLGQSLKIATWNIEHLRANNGQGAVPRNTDDYNRLKKYADRLDADVVALQEVDGEDAAERVFDPAVYDFYFSRRNHVMRTGFAVKKTLTVIHHPDFEDLDVNGNQSLRYGADITVISGTDSMRLLSIHLKSRCFQNSLSMSNSSHCIKLRRQLLEVEEWIDQRSEESLPFLVLGDFNRRLNIPHDEFWIEIDDQVPANSDLHKVTEGNLSDCLDGRYPEYIDHIILDARATDLFDPTSFGQIVFDDADDPFVDQLSDHCPIFIALDLESHSPPTCNIEAQLTSLQTMVDSLQMIITDLRQNCCGN